MVAAGVVEGWQALDAEIHLPPYDPHVADEPVRLLRTRHDRHEVKCLGKARRREEAGQEHVGIGQVELVAVGVLHRSQREMPAFLVVEDGAKNTRGVEGWQAQPVYGAIGTDERSRVQIPDDTVVLDRQIPHSTLPSQHRYPCLYLTAPCEACASATTSISASQHAQASPSLLSPPPDGGPQHLSQSSGGSPQASKPTSLPCDDSSCAARQARSRRS